MRLSSLVSCTVILAAAPSLAAEAPIGEWLVADRHANVRIEDCGGALWGVVSGELKSGPDSQNPDPALRGRPTLGMPVLLDMKDKESANWGEKTTRHQGHFYDAKNGKTYEASIRLLTLNLMKVEACELGGVFCGGQHWTRVQVSSAGKTGPKGNAPVAPLPTSVIPAGDVCSRVVNLPARAH